MMLKAGGEGGDRGLDDWIASSDSMDINLSKLQKTARDRKTGVLESMGSQRLRHD